MGFLFFFWDPLYICHQVWVKHNTQNITMYPYPNNGIEEYNLEPAGKKKKRDPSDPPSPARDFLYRRMVSEARGDLFVRATCLENSDQSLTLFLTE